MDVDCFRHAQRRRSVNSYVSNAALAANLRTITPPIAGINPVGPGGPATAPGDAAPKSATNESHAMPIRPVRSISQPRKEKVHEIVTFYAQKFASLVIV